MAAITYGAGASAATTTSVKTATVKPSTAPVWTRLWNAFVEARMRQAMREVALHRHLLPAELEATFNRGTAKINP